jgi:chromosome segregation ATPase
MDHAERVKKLSQEFANAAAIVGGFGDSKPNRDRVDKKVAELHTAIDAMQDALDDATRQRDKYMGLWAALSQEEGKAERAIEELEAKLAARDVEVGRLRKLVKE